jgi:lipoprotein LprG
MPLRRQSRILPLLAALLGLALSLLTACSGSSSGPGDPKDALQTAQQKLEDTSGVSFTLATDDLPDGVQGVKGASGTVTDSPAFDGTLTVSTSLGEFDIPVKAVDGKVYAKIPLTPGWSEVDPADYGAPDPSQLTKAGQGVPSILAATTGAKKGGQTRGGKDNKEVLTTYTGTVPATAVAHLIPSASGDFDAKYSLTDDGELRSASLTGAFYSGKPPVTYTLELDDYGTTKDVTAP